MICVEVKNDNIARSCGEHAMNPFFVWLENDLKFFA
jgi:hypothetical protein